jgi:hypothetical protein
MFEHNCVIIGNGILVKRILLSLVMLHITYNSNSNKSDNKYILLGKYIIAKFSRKFFHVYIYRFLTLADISWVFAISYIHSIT